MAGKHTFRFKQFTVTQQNSAMKVGTDGVLLGAWANISGAMNILDVGTGTGLIALMLAQRSQACITGVEIDQAASLEASQNVQHSPWPRQIKIVHSAFQDFPAMTSTRYDLVVSNLPFFTNDTPPTDHRRKTARHTHTLPFDSFIHTCMKLLTPQGRVEVILPAANAKLFLEIAARSGLFAYRKTWVKPNPAKLPHRVMLGLSEIAGEITENLIMIESERHHDYTPEYRQLTKDFYLGFT